MGRQVRLVTPVVCQQASAGFMVAVYPDMSGAGGESDSGPRLVLVLNFFED